MPCLNWVTVGDIRPRHRGPYRPSLNHDGDFGPLITLFPLHISKHSIACDLISAPGSVRMASVAMNVITGGPKIITPSSLSDRLLWSPHQNPPLLQIRGDEDKNRVIIAPDLWEKPIHKAMDRGGEREGDVILIIQGI